MKLPKGKQIKLNVVKFHNSNDRGARSRLKTTTQYTAHYLRQWPPDWFSYTEPTSDARDGRDRTTLSI